MGVRGVEEEEPDARGGERTEKEKQKNRARQTRGRKRLSGSRE